MSFPKRRKNGIAHRVALVGRRKRKQNNHKWAEPLTPLRNATWLATSGAQGDGAKVVIKIINKKDSRPSLPCFFPSPHTRLTFTDFFPSATHTAAADCDEWDAMLTSSCSAQMSFRNAEGTTTVGQYTACHVDDTMTKARANDDERTQQTIHHPRATAGGIPFYYTCRFSPPPHATVSGCLPLRVS